MDSLWQEMSCYVQLQRLPSFEEGSAIGRTSPLVARGSANNTRNCTMSHDGQSENTHQKHENMKDREGQWRRKLQTRQETMVGKSVLSIHIHSIVKVLTLLRRAKNCSFRPFFRPFAGLVGPGASSLYLATTLPCKIGSLIQSFVYL